jgi:iron complex transport system substrate-binding protein
VVKDANGTEVTIEKEPVNIVSLTLGSDEMLLGLIDKSRIKAVTEYSIDTGISNVADVAKDVPNKILSDAEKVISLQPDLVFVDTWADPNFVKQLRDAKIAVYVFKTPSNIDEQKAAVQELAHVVGADAKGKEIVAWMDEKLAAVEDKLKNLKPEEKLSVMDYSESGSSSGKGTNFDDIVTHAGLINVVTKAGMEGWPTLSKENIVAMNPDIILLPSWYYDKTKSLDGLKDTLMKDTSLASVKTIKDKKLLSVPNPHISAISQYVVLGVEDLAKAAYPDLFK